MADFVQYPTNKYWRIAITLLRTFVNNENKEKKQDHETQSNGLLSGGHAIISTHVYAEKPPLE